MLHLCGTAQMADLIDILVVGAGPAGANAALAAARHGKHVVLLDEQVNLAVRSGGPKTAQFYRLHKHQKALPEMPYARRSKKLRLTTAAAPVFGRSSGKAKVGTCMS